MRWLLALSGALALAGCATGSSTVSLLNDEGVSTSGAVVVLDPKTEMERGQLTLANTTAKVGGRNLRAKPAKASLFSELFAWLPYAPRTYVLYFKEGTTDLTDESLPILEALRVAVKANTEVQVTGHTDRVGDDATNDALSIERAREVRAALVRNGLPVENSRVTGRGEREPRVATEDNVAEAANRRAEVILR